MAVFLLHLKKKRKNDHLIMKNELIRDLEN